MPITTEDGEVVIVTGPTTYQFVFDPTLRIVGRAGDTVARDGDVVAASGARTDDPEVFILCHIESLGTTFPTPPS